jgi:hypothetical protein
MASEKRQKCTLAAFARYLQPQTPQGGPLNRLVCQIIFPFLLSHASSYEHSSCTATNHEFHPILQFYFLPSTSIPFSTNDTGKIFLDVIQTFDYFFAVDVI